MAPHVTLVHVDVGCLDAQPTSVRHRVTRVDGEIHDDLLELTRVHFHGSEGGGEGRGQGDVFSQQPCEHLLGAGHDRIDVEDARLEDLLATEREQLPGQRTRPHGGLADLLDVLPVRRVRGPVFEQQIAVAENHGEQVVEVVRDPAG